MIPTTTTKSMIPINDDIDMCDYEEEEDDDYNDYSDNELPDLVSESANDSDDSDYLLRGPTYLPCVPSAGEHATAKAATNTCKTHEEQRGKEEFKHVENYITRPRQYKLLSYNGYIQILRQKESSKLCYTSTLPKTDTKRRYSSDEFDQDDLTSEGYNGDEDDQEGQRQREQYRHVPTTMTIDKNDEDKQWMGTSSFSPLPKNTSHINQQTTGYSTTKHSIR